LGNIFKEHLTSQFPNDISADDDRNDCDVRAADISPLDPVKTLSYDELKILMETLEKEATRMSTNASHLAGKSAVSEGSFLKLP
jgi:hypothetical protein